MRDSKYIKEIKIKIINKAPLKIGNGKEDFDILVDKATNKPMILGSSIAGAFKNYLYNNNEEHIEDVFGSENNEKDKNSKIYVLDAYANVLDIHSRTGIRRDDKYGVAKDKAKYDINFINEDTQFELGFKVFAKDEKELKICDDYLSKCIRGIINENLRLGSNKTSGFGVFDVKNVSYREFNLSSSTGLSEYILDNKDFGNIDINKLKDIDTSDSFVKFTFKGKIKDSMIIKEYNAISDKDVDCDSLKNPNGKYIIPGSTIKGLSRAYIEKALKTLDKDVSIAEKLYGSSPDNKKVKAMGRVYAQDTTIEKVSYTTYNRIKVDRFTGGVIEGGKFNERRINGQVSFDIIFSKTKDDILNNSVVALMTMFLRDLSLSKVVIGSSSNVGSGRFVGESIVINDNNKCVTINFDDEDIKINNKEYLDTKIESLKQLKGED